MSFPRASLLPIAIALIGPAAAGETPPQPTPPSIRQMLASDEGSFFWIERRHGAYRMGDPASDFNSRPDVDLASFDIGNGKALANLGVNGVLRSVAVYRDSYEVDAGRSAQRGWNGVWMAKDNSVYGPYSYAVTLGDRTSDLAAVDWDFRTGLLDNIFPLTEFRDPAGLASVKLIAYAPVSADGAERIRGIVYGLELTNLSGHPLRGKIRRPQQSFPGRPQRLTWSTFDPFDFELGTGIGEPFAPEVAFDLPPGGSLWVPTVIYPPGDPAPDRIAERGSAAWLADSWRYYRGLLGRLRIPDRPFLAEFYERQALEALQSLALTPDGRLAGSNWGSTPVTRMIWMKDCYYASLPCTALEPDLARQAILWFDRHGVCPPRTDGSGGVNHSVSVSVAAPLLAGLYYDRTGDRGFFLAHPELKLRWAALLDEVISSRRDRDVWLFPTRFVSDGAVSADYHTGSNVAVWRALVGYAELRGQVYGDAEGEARYRAAADRVRAAIERKTVVPGPFGPQFIEGTYRDGRAPEMVSDGEESDTTLMPYYGFLPYDDDRYLNYMRFSFSPFNRDFNPVLRSLGWSDRVPSTAPGYNKGLCAGVSEADEFGPQGYATEIRRLADADGSLWWWNYGAAQHPVHGQPVRAFRGIGKSGWTAGVYTVLFPHRFLGLEYDAPRRVFRFAPLKLVGGFDWNDLPEGRARFGVGIRYAGGADEMHFENPNDFPVEVDAELPVRSTVRSVRAGGQSVTFAPGRRLGEPTVRFTVDVPASGAVQVEVRE